MLRDALTQLYTRNRIACECRVIRVTYIRVRFGYFAAHVIARI